MYFPNAYEPRIKALEAKVERLTTALADTQALLNAALAEHMSDCPVNNGPALPPGPCNCKDRKRARRR